VDWSVIAEHWDFVAEGLKDTVLLSLLGLGGAVAIGLLAATMRLSRLPPLRWTAGLYVDFFRSTPLFIQLVWLFYAMPSLLDIQMSAFTAGAIGLALYEGSFFTEVFRAGILSVPTGQREAALAQGMTGTQAMRRVVMPQALRNMLPPATSSTVTLIKDSSLVSVIGVADLMWQANELAASSFQPFEVLTFVAFLYLLLTYPLTLLANYLHRRMLGGSERSGWRVRLASARAQLGAAALEERV
jgi:polar amino acid transport system permease protein